MRKLLFSLIAVLVVLPTVFATAAEGPGGTSWTFKFSSNKANTAVGTTSVIRPAFQDDQGNYASAKKSTIRFPKGTAVDTSVPKRCKFTASDVGSGREDCPSKTRLGKGSARVLVGKTFLNATIDAFNKKKTILFVVQTCGQNTGPTSGKPCDPAGPPNVLEGRWSKVSTRPTLTVPTPQSLLDLGVTIVEFKLVTKKITKRVKVKKKRVLRSFVFTPRKCKKTWSSSATEEYVSRSSLKLTDTLVCRK